MTLGAVPFSIYLTSAPEQIDYVVEDAGARSRSSRRSSSTRCRPLEHVVVIDGDGPLRLEDVEGSNPDFDVEAAWRAVEPEDLLTLIYTSGTTGPPKGVQLDAPQPARSGREHRAR